MLYRVLDAISDALYGVLQIHDRLFQAGESNFIKSTVSILGFMAVDYFTHNILLASCVFIIVFILGIILLDIRNINHIQPIPKNPFHNWDVRKMAVKLLPFALIMFLPTVLNNISKYFIQLWHPNDQGYFNILILPLFFLTLVITFVISPFLTRLARLFNKGEITDFKRTVNRISVLALMIGVLLIPVTYLLASPILSFVFGIDFRQYNTQLTLIVISGIVYTLATVYSSVLVIIRKINIQFTLLTILLLMNIFLSVVFIRPLSIDGAIFVSILTNVVWLMSFWLVYNINIRKVVKGEENAK